MVIIPQYETEMNIENKTISFAIQVATICKTEVEKRGSNIILDHLLDSCVTAGVAVREYEYADSRTKMVGYLSQTQQELFRTLYWLDLLYETGGFGVEAYEELSVEVNAIIKLVK